MASEYILDVTRGYVDGLWAQLTFDYPNTGKWTTGLVLFLACLDPTVLPVCSHLEQNSVF